MNLLHKPHHKKSFFTQSVDMLHGPVVRSMIIFMIPMMLSAILQSLFSAADIAVVGNFASKESVAAIGTTTSVINFLVGVSISLSAGVNIILSRAIGMADEHRMRRTVGTATVLSLSLGVLLAVVGILVTYPLLRLTSCPDNIIDQAALYMRLYLISMPASLFYNFLSPVVTLNGDSTRPFIYLSVSGVANVVLNLIFVVGFGMDVVGVALATVISLYLSAFLLLLRITRVEGACRLNLRNLNFSWYTFRKILQYGIPSSISGATSCISSMYIQTIVNAYQDVGISGNTAAASLEGFMFSIFGVLGGAIPAFMGQAIGADDRARVFKILKVGLLMTVSVGVLFGFIAAFLGEALLSIYLPGEEEAIAFGLIRLRHIMMLSVLCAVTYVQSAMMFAFGRTVLQMVNDLCFYCAFRVVWLAVIYKLHPCPEMLYLTFPVSWLCVCLVMGVACFIVLRDYKRGAVAKL